MKTSAWGTSQGTPTQGLGTATFSLPLCQSDSRGTDDLNPEGESWVESAALSVTVTTQVAWQGGRQGTDPDLALPLAEVPVDPAQQERSPLDSR